MTRHKAVQPRNETANQLAKGLKPHIAVRADHDHVLLPNAHNNQHLTGRYLPVSQEPRFGHDFSKVRARSSTAMVGQNYATATCPAYPQRCPFGGACHACPTTVQTKLMVGKPGDKYEQEADRVADQVMRMLEPEFNERASVTEKAQVTHLQRECPECDEELRRQPEEEEEEELLQSKETSGPKPELTPDVQTQIDTIRGTGKPLSESDCSFFEPRFGHIFSGVQVHTGTPAVETARAINAKAFTVGRDIVFGAGQFAPNSYAGKQLLAHELTHVIQQTPRLSNKSLVIQRQQPPGGGQPTRAAPAECVQPRVIRRDFTLACDCFNPIRVAADNITLDCAGHRINGSGRGTGILLRGRTGVTVKNCHVRNFANGIGLRRSSSNIFTGNTSTENRRGGFDLRRNSHENEFMGNTANNNRRDGFDLNDSNGNTFTGNTANSNPRNGIELDRCVGNTFTGNTANNNRDGFDLDGGRDNAPSNILRGNTANENERDGFRIRSDSNTFAGNIANNNNFDGFHIEGNGPDNTFTQNTANNNNEDGFDLQMPGNTLRGNTANENGRDGFHIRSDSNTFAGNIANNNTDDDFDLRSGTTGNTCRSNTFTHPRCLEP